MRYCAAMLVVILTGCRPTVIVTQVQALANAKSQ